MKRVVPLVVWGSALALAFTAPALGSPAAGQVRVPDGYRVQTVASGIPYASNIALDERGGLWVTSAANDLASEGWVWHVGRTGSTPNRVIGPLSSALGLVWLHHKLYVSSVVSASGQSYVGRVTAYWGFTGSSFRHSDVVVDGIPVGLHRVDSLAVGPGDRLFLGVGSQTDRDPPSARLSASVISFRPDGGDVRVEASGLRNPYGLTFLPGTSQLLVTDEGVDFPGNQPPDELNSFDVADPPPDFGFPECYGQGGAGCKGTTPAFVRLDPHAAAGGVAVVSDFGRLGPSAFVAEYGSSPGFGTHETGAQIVRVPLPGGRVRTRAVATTFASGFNHPDPLGLASGPGPSLYVTLWYSGAVIRISPKNAAASAPAVTSPLWLGVVQKAAAALLGPAPAFVSVQALVALIDRLESGMTRSASQP